MQKNVEYSGVVEALGTEGEGIIKVEEETAFVPFCLTGERVSFKALKAEKGIVYGKLTEVHTVSSDRETPLCPVYGRCGGCHIQHLKYAAQLQFKRTLVENALKKIGGLDVAVSPTVASDSQFNYRNKLAIPVGEEEGRTKIGFFAPRSHRIVEIKDCPLQRDWSGRLIAELKEFMRERNYKGYDEFKRRGDVRHLVAREVRGRLIITVVTTRALRLDGFAERLKKTVGEFTLLNNVNTSSSNVIFGNEWHICWGEGFFDGDDGGIKYKAGADTFLQVNDGVRSKLYAAVLDAARGKNKVALDLYSGGGMLTAMLAKACKAAYGVEIVKQASDCAQQLKELNGLVGKMFNICGAVEDEIDGVMRATDGEERVIVCDPPRKGMERSVIKAVLNSGAEEVILISCNPATLARDVGLLCGSLIESDGRLIKNANYSSAGEGYYKVKSVTPFDMFPQTKHVETLVTLSLAKV